MTTTTDAVGEIGGSWLFDLVWQMSQFAASRGGLAALLDEFTLLSTELPDIAVPLPYVDRFVNENQRVGVLLGLVDSAPPPQVVGQMSQIQLVNVKLLTLPELTYAAEFGPDGRQELVRRFAAARGRRPGSEMG